jgi:hypothetical protein
MLVAGHDASLLEEDLCQHHPIARDQLAIQHRGDGFQWHI